MQELPTMVDNIRCVIPTPGNDHSSTRTRLHMYGPFTNLFGY